MSIFLRSSMCFRGPHLCSKIPKINIQGLELGRTQCKGRVAGNPWFTWCNPGVGITTRPVYTVCASAVISPLKPGLYSIRAYARVYARIRAHTPTVGAAVYTSVAGCAQRIRAHTPTVAVKVQTCWTFKASADQRRYSSQSRKRSKVTEGRRVDLHRDVRGRIPTHTLACSNFYPRRNLRYAVATHRQPEAWTSAPAAGAYEYKPGLRQWLVSYAKTRFKMCHTFKHLFICNTFCCRLILLSLSLYTELALVCCTNPNNVNCFGTIFPNLNFVFASNLSRPPGPYWIRPIQKLLNCQTRTRCQCYSIHPYWGATKNSAVALGLRNNIISIHLMSARTNEDKTTLI